VTQPPAVRRRLIERHLPLVRSVARRYAGGAEPLDDLVQVGSIGLIKAVDRYDADRGTAFPAYAAPFIAGEIRHHLRDRCAPVRVPRRLQEEGVRVVAVGLDSADDARAVAAGLDGAGDAHADPMAQTRDRLAVGAALRALRPRERRLVQLRFVEDLSQAQIARLTGMSQVQVSRMLSGALTRLRDELAVSSSIG
jgi:RNA polymerase sigma-B factor